MRPPNLLGFVALVLLAVLAGCADEGGGAPAAQLDTGLADAGATCDAAPFATGGLSAPSIPLDGPDPRAVEQVVYELQVRSANACDPTVGTEAARAACLARPAPDIEYRAVNSTCDDLRRLERIRLGTFDDLRADTADFRDGITLRYIAEQVGATTVWLQPVFPNNDRINLPTGCDNLGSPYAVRDYFHTRGTLSAQCIAEGRDEYSDPPCWGNDTFRDVLDDADALGLDVWVDVAFNHFGHDYLVYDLLGHEPVRRRLARGEDPDDWWDFDATFEPALLDPEVLDTPNELEALAAANAQDAADLDALDARCPSLAGHRRVRAFAAWRMAFDEERASFDCDADTLEGMVPGLLLGSPANRPSTGGNDTFTREWYDVNFLFHRREDPRWDAYALRTREYVFRALNHLVALGVDGFRLDHATNDTSGIRGPTWAYLMAKVEFYAAQRGQDAPLWMAEEFHNQDEMSGVADVMTEGYLFDLAGRGGVIKDAAHVEGVLERANRFGFRTLVLAHLENHDEVRLTTDTGFSPWTGAGFWALGLSSWTTPMLLVGQEFGQPDRLEFKRSHYLTGRFAPRDDADELLAFYRELIEIRRSDAGAALRGTGRRFLRQPDGSRNGGVLGMMRYDADRNALLVLHNLWESEGLSTWVLPSDLAGGLGMDPCTSYRAVDLVSGRQIVGCTPATELVRGFNVWLGWRDRVVWAEWRACE